MTPLATTPSSSRRPSTISTTWASQYHSESSSVATIDLFSFDSSGSDKQLLGAADNRDLYFSNDHTSPYGSDEPLSLTSHGLPTAQGCISPSSTGAEELGISSVPYISDLFADASGACKISPSNGIDECLARTMFESSAQTPTSHTAPWPSMMADPSPSTVVPSQTVTMPMTPQKPAFSAMTIPIKNEFISLPLQCGDEVDSSTSSTATTARDFPIQTKRTKAAEPQIKSESKPRRRNQQQPKAVTTSRGVTYTVSTIEKTSRSDPCLEWMPDPKHPDGGQHCMKVFGRNEHLARHRRTHRPEEWPCLLCGKPLTRKDNLKPHYLTHRPKSGNARLRARNPMVESDEVADQLGLYGPKPCKQRVRDGNRIRKRQSKL